MSNNPLNGEWIGHFTYGEMYPANLQEMKFGFEMKLNANGDQIDGTCVDDDLKGKLETPASIKGNIHEDHFNLNKQYPFAFSIDPTGSVHKDEKQTPPIVHYKGSYNADTGSCEGHWRIVAMMETGRNQVSEQVFAGKFTMKKKF